MLKKSKKKYFEVGNIYFPIICIFVYLVVVLVCMLLDFVTHSFHPACNYKMMILFWAVTSFPFLFVRAKVRVEGDKMTVIKVCGLRRTFRIDEINKVVIFKPDDESKTNIVSHITVYNGRRKFSINSSLENYDRFYNYIIDNIEPDKIICDVWHVVVDENEEDANEDE